MRPRPATPPTLRPRGGLTLVETLTAITVTTVAGSALITALGAALSAHTHAARAAVAAGLADDLAAEVFARPVRAPADATADLPPRSSFDEVDDYAGWDRRPPVEPNGDPCGTRPGADAATNAALRPAPDLLSRYRRTVIVRTVEPDGANGWRPGPPDSEHRRVTVQVWFDRDPGGGGDEVLLAERTGVLSRVDAAP